MMSTWLQIAGVTIGGIIVSRGAMSIIPDALIYDIGGNMNLLGLAIVMFGFGLGAFGGLKVVEAVFGVPIDPNQKVDRNKDD